MLTKSSSQQNPQANASGQQFVLTLLTPNGKLHATIASRGASLREFRIGNIELVEPYDADSDAPLCAGKIMSPWVNRLDHGQWTYQGEVLHNPITLTEQDNANHGLLLDYLYKEVDSSPTSVTLEAVIEPSEGYPFHVVTRVTYALVTDGLVVTHRAANLSEAAAPYATGAHPYFKFSEVDAADLTVTLPAATRTVVDSRQIPVGEEPASAAGIDLAAGVRVGDHHIDDDFTDLARDESGLAHTLILSADARGLDVWQDSSFKHVVLFTPSFFPTIVGGRTHAVAVEPSTAAPNAFNSGKNLIWLEPGAAFEGRWGVRVLL
jgi:aldose 1-epimerase